MAVTAISDIINPEVLADQVSAKYPDMLVLGNSNLVEVDSTFPLGSPGTAFKLPFWKRIGAFGSMTEGVALTPGKVTAAAEYAIVQRGGGAYEVYDTAQLVSKADPVAEVANQISRRAAEYLDAALVVEAKKSPNTYDQSVISSGLLDQNTFASAMTVTLGDNFAKLQQGGAAIMHSKTFGDLMKTGAIQNQYQSGMDVIRTGMVPTLMGLPIVVSDLVSTSTVSGTTFYDTYLIGPGSLALFYQRQVMVEFDRDILLQADIIAATVHFSPHLFGWDDQGNALAAEQAKSIHVVTIKSK
jgi:hypothetical protein